MAEKELEQLVQWFDDYEEASFEARQLAEKDRDFYDGKQWTEDEENELEKRGQAASVFNRIAPKIDFILGMEAQTRTVPKAHPRTPVEEGGADAATDAVRFVMDFNDWDQERSDAGEDLFIEGTCGVDVRVESGPNNESVVKIERIPWDRLFWDPRSRWHDFRDAKYFGTVVWMDVEDAKARWPDKEDVIDQSVNTSRTSWDETSEDRPHFGVWSDYSGNRPRVKVSQIWYHVGEEWYVATYTRAGFFESPRTSPYFDSDLNTVPGLLIQSAKVDRDNNRYGVVRQLISPQEEINKRRSKSLHLLNMRQVVAEKGAVEDRERARQELARPDGWVEVHGNARFELSNTNDMSSGHLALLTDAKGEIDAIGANAALTGKDPRAQSGRAIQARQQGGAIELARTFDRFRAWQLRVYRAAWLRVRQFWTAKRMIRVTDDERNVKYVGLNQPMTRADMLMHQGQQIPENPTPEQVLQLKEVIGIKNELAALDVDIVMDQSPDVLTLQDEQFNQLTSLLGSLGGALPPPAIMLMLELIIEASGLRRKNELAQMIRTGGVTPEQQQQAQQKQAQQEQIQQAAIALDMQAKQADIQKTRTSSFKDLAQGQAALQDAAAKASQKQLEDLGLA